MDLLIGLGILGGLVAWGVVGWWRYWAAVQAAIDNRRLSGSQIEALWRQIDAQARRPAAEQDAQSRRDAWAEKVLDEVTRDW